jgi:septum formation protein
MGLRFTTAAPSVADEEQFLRTGPLRRSLQTLAIAKARSVSRANLQSLVLGADTVVVLGKRVLGKPKSGRDARAMMSMLSGEAHNVFTAVALVCEECGFVASAVAKTRVVFRAISKEELDEYMKNGDWRGKAGAYAIQGKAMMFIDKIEGCYYNVVGLPVRTTIDRFMEYSSRRDAPRKESVHG